jgi:asparagine N-glycosylation enzyme membrane subunit Stt3
MDLRIPTGAFFVLLGGILLVLGFAAPSLRAPLTEVNVNMYAGSAMALFGGILLWLAKRHS